MIEIRHKSTGEVLATVPGDTLRDADLRGAYLRAADLRGADLTGASLRGANLGGADLGNSTVSGADLTGAYLAGADLRGADPGDWELDMYGFARRREEPAADPPAPSERDVVAEVRAAIKGLREKYRSCTNGDCCLDTAACCLGTIAAVLAGLQPCPHCGEPATVSGLSSRVTCQNCGATAPDAAAWNRRVP